MPFDLSLGEILVVMLVALLVFGGKLPDAARRIGSTISEFKRGMHEELRRLDEGPRREPPPPVRRPPDEGPMDQGPTEGPTENPPSPPGPSVP